MKPATSRAAVASKENEPVIGGELNTWAPMSISFCGPDTKETDSVPNPFLDYRLQVEFIGPSGQRYDVPGFFDGDGRGAGEGNVWRVRFTADEPGQWKYQASFRAGEEIAVSPDPSAGEPTGCDGQSGSFEVASTATDAPGFLKWGRLEYAGGHYLKFRDAPYWIRGGADSPENFLAYAGFDHTPPSHKYAVHKEDWHPGDPDWNKGRGQAIIGALNYLSSKRVNSIHPWVFL
jgi:hypothetical protein